MLSMIAIGKIVALVVLAICAALIVAKWDEWFNDWRDGQ